MAFSKARRLSDLITANGQEFITSAHITDTAITHADLHTNMDLTGKTVLVANASTGDSDTTAANTAFVQQEIAALVDSSPSALNTLNELAAALGDDANFSTTVTNSIATKLPLAGGTMSGNLNMGSQDITNLDTLASTHFSSSANINSSGDGGLFIPNGKRLGFDQSGTRSWTQYAAGGNLLFASGDGNGAIQANNFTGVTLTLSGTIKAGNVLSTHGHANADDFIVGNISGSATGLTIVNADGGTGNIHFSDGTSSGNANIQGQLVYAHNDNSMRFYTAVAEKMRLKSTGHLTLNHVNHSFSGVDNSLLASSNGYLYAMGGSSGLYLADNSALSNAIGIRDANYIDFVTNGQSILKFDTTGIQFQRADGQAITAKESIVMTVDADNNTASRVFQVNHGNGKTLLNLHDDYRMEVGTIHHAATRTAGYSQSNGLGASAGDWVDIATVPYGRNIATIKIFWDGIYAPSSSHHGNMEFDIGSHYGTSYYYGWDSYINLKASSAHNSFYISEARIISPGGSGATGYFQVKFGVATGTNGTIRAYVTHRDESCSIDPITPVVNNSRNGGTTIAQIKLGDNGGFTNNRVALATSRDMHIGGGLTIATQPSAMAWKSGHYYETSGVNDVTGWGVQHDVGGDFVASTGVFTCPTDGRYLCTFSPMSGQTSGDVQFRIYKNTALALGSNSMAQGGGPWRQTTVTGVIDCDAGDTLRPRAYSNVTSASVHQVYTGSYSTLSFHLLG